MQQAQLSRRELEYRASAALELDRRNREAKSARLTVIGFVTPEGKLTHAVQGGKPSKLTPDVYFPAVYERARQSTKRFICLIGGRGSAKSVSVADDALIDAKDYGHKTYCLREYQSSIKNSIQNLLTSEAERLEFDGFTAQGQGLLYKEEELFQFLGLARNIDSIKSAHGFHKYIIEEAQFLTSPSLQALTPTARNKPNKGLPQTQAELEADTYAGVSMIFIANPRSSADPFSQRFIQPFLKDLLAHGFYEDELHLIVMMNYDDNPWFMESGLEQERQYDLKNRSEAEYQHIWQGGYNDEVENSIITVNEFNSAIDAHKRLGFKPSGAIVASHDPSDLGDDNKGYACRQGSVITRVSQKLDGDVNEGMDWALALAVKDGADLFVWDADGMGVGLKPQVVKAFQGKKIDYYMFHGGGSVEDPEQDYIPSESYEKAKRTRNKDTFLNLRSQKFITLADRFKNTYRAIEKGEYIDPETLISIDSDGVDNMDELRAEVCRIPRKDNNNGKIQILSKIDMAKPPLRIPSPGMGDSLMMGQMNPKAKNKAKPINFAGWNS